MRFLLLICALAIPATAVAETLKSESVICLTKEKYDQLTRAIANNDRRGVEHLNGNGCLLIGKAMEVSVLETPTFSSAAKIRIYTDRGTAEVWTSRKFLSD